MATEWIDDFEDWMYALGDAKERLDLVLMSGREIEAVDLAMRFIESIYDGATLFLEAQ